MNRFFTLLALVALTAVSCKQESMEELTARVFERAAAQVKYMDTCLEPIAAVSEEPVLPRSINPDGTLWTSNHKWWCSGFYPGTLWFVYEYTGDEQIKALAQKYQAPLEPIRFRKNHHDVGFQLMCSYGNCLRLTADAESEAIIKDGANSLATRFDPEVGCTRSWNSKKWTYAVIVDNMMNLELLLKGAELSGDENLKEIALTHSRTTMKNHYREDFSSYHLVDYDPETGAVLGKQTVQGYADDSAWARGQAWGLYGYTMVYRFTKEQDMLDQAIAIAEYIIPRLPKDYVPFWDFDAPDIPNDVRDASSGSLIASALIELSTYVDAEKAARYLSVAENTLSELASERYLAKEGEQYGFILKHSTGSKPGNSEVDVPLTYADYYFLEALLRWKAIVK